MEPFEGIRVVELSVAVQGPAAGGLLAGLGADVTKVEPPGGEANRWYRSVGNRLPAAAVGTQFLGVNAGKRSISLDIHTAVGREVVDRLIAGTDVFLSNFREPALERMGVGYEALHERYPRLIYAVANGFGQFGPARQNRMSDSFAQARSGISSVTGHPGDAPVIPGAIVGDTGGAMALALGIVTALLARERTGAGQKVSTSAYGALLWMQSWEINHSSVTGHVLRREGAYHAGSPQMTGIYETADGGAFCLGIRDDENWRAFCEFGRTPELADDPRWDTARKRNPADGLPHASEEELDEIRLRLRPAIAAVMRRRRTDEWTDFFEIHPDGIVAQRVFDYADVLADEQARANGYVVEKEIPHVGRRKLVGNPVHLSETPGSPKALFAEHGEHTAEIMRALGFDDAAIAEVEAQRTPGAGAGPGLK